jgi:hypothetical protein
MQKSLLTLVIAVTLVLVSFTATSATKNVLKDLNSLTVVDAHGTKVGKLLTISSNDSGILAFEVDRRPFLLRVSQQNLSGTSAIVYDSSDCSGPPFIATSPTPLFSPSGVSAPGHTLYLPEPDAEPVIINPSGSSELTENGTCVPRAGAGLSPVLFVPAQPIIDLDTLFTPPFNVR